jgi:hypothetical protein
LVDTATAREVATAYVAEAELEYAEDELVAVTPML